MKKLFTLFALMAVSTVFAQNVTVTFRVDLGAQVYKGFYIPASDSITVRGSFQEASANGGSNWSGWNFKMADADADTVYTVDAVIPATFAGTTYEFKFVKGPDGWEGIASNRTFTLAASGNQVLPAYWFNDDSAYTTVVLVTNTLNFTADLSTIYGTGVGRFDPAQDSLLVMGLDWDGLGTVLSGERRLFEDPLTPRIFTTSMTFKGPLGDSTKWKFKAFPDARFTNTGWETGSDRWWTYVTDNSVVDLDPIVPRIFPVTGNLAQNVTALYQVNMSGPLVNKLNGLPIDPAQVQWVGLKGGSAPIGNWAGNWVASDTTAGYMRVLNDAGIDGDKVAGDKIWSDTVVFWTGLGAGAIEYKYAVAYPGYDTVNGGTTPLDNEGGFGENHLFFLALDITYAELYNIFGDFLTSVKEDETVFTPGQFSLGQNYPNPFNPSTKISYSIPVDGIVTLRVYNLIGQEVATLVENFQLKGGYTASFDASKLNSGVYFYTLSVGDYSVTKKMMLLK
ncbi:MAG: hypothetical protein AMXMBFR48_17950 [Ignavibacteriales bacterium]